MQETCELTEPLVESIPDFLRGKFGEGGKKLAKFLNDLRKKFPDVNLEPWLEQLFRLLDLWDQKSELWDLLKDLSNRFPELPFLAASGSFSQTVRSYDPNDKVGPAGYGGAQFTSVDSILPYQIRFENRAEATAPAQKIVITDTLDDDLDLSTFELTAITFAKHIILIPQGLNHYETALDLVVDNEYISEANLRVEINAALDLDTRELTVTLIAIDPATGWLPQDVMLGLLYPNDDTGRGDGHISYIVKPKAGLALGTQITNMAHIYFDWNDPIDTPLVLNTVDAGALFSSILPLPETISSTTSFEVNWSGEDDAGGSGIASYDIYVSTDVGPFALWQEQTTDTEAMFVGEYGHTYAFYSVVRDNIGYIEDPPSMADTQMYIAPPNVPPIVIAGPDETINEGQLFTRVGTFVDDDIGDSWTATVDYGDDSGLQPLILDGKTFSLSYVYADDGTYPVTVTVTDSYGESDSDQFTITIMNVAPMIELTGPASVEEGSTYILTLGAVTDPGDDTITEYIVHWGDGTNDTYSGNRDVTHVYADGPANHTIVVDLVDEDGTHSGSGTLDVQVTNVIPSLADAAFELQKNSPNGTVVGTVSGSDPGDDTLTYSIVGGSGASAFAIDAITGRITVADETQLDYETTLSFTLEVQVADDDNATDTATVTIDLLNLASITGVVFVDVNENGVYEANEPGIDGITIELLDENNVPVLDTLGNPVTAMTSDGGFYLFEDLDPGTYLLHEVQPTGVNDGDEILGSLGGAIAANDTMRLTLERIDATDYIFAELGQSVASGDTATIRFWQNKHGQALIRQGGKALADWLTNNFNDVFGDTFIGGDGDDVASFYRIQLFLQKSQKSAGPAKVDAQFMAVALATYFTSSNLAGNIASDYGFNVTDIGIGTKVVNVGSNGAAFGVANGSDLTIMQLLLATNDLTDKPDNLSGFTRIYDLNGDGEIDEVEASLRRLANEVYSAINEQGDI